MLTRFNGKKIVYLALCFLTILFIRNFVAIILLPCALTWVISKKYNLPAIKGFAALLVLGLIGTLVLNKLSEKLDPLQIVVNKQQAFFALGKANTDYKMDTLKPTVKSFTNQLPAALRHSFLSPYPTEFNNVYMILFSLEMMTYWVLFLMMIFLPDKTQSISVNTFIVFGIAFAFLILLFTGYITPAAGALIRYRSIYLPFLITPILCKINWQTIFKKLTYYIFYNVNYFVQIH